MKSKTAIFWCRNDLLAQAMEFFLTAKETWEVIRIPIERGADYLVKQANRISPDVIILYTGNCVNDPSLPVRLIQDQPNLKVVTVNLEDNQMQVYSKHSVTVRTAADLLTVIEDRYFSDHPV